jgi:hypothetical protein
MVYLIHVNFVSSRKEDRPEEPNPSFVVAFESTIGQVVHQAYFHFLQASSQLLY